MKSTNVKHTFLSWQLQTWQENCVFCFWLISHWVFIIVTVSSHFKGHVVRSEVNLTRHFYDRTEDPLLLCNDGSTGGYYIREATSEHHADKEGVIHWKLFFKFKVSFVSVDLLSWGRGLVLELDLLPQSPRSQWHPVRRQLPRVLLALASDKNIRGRDLPDGGRWLGGG